MPAGAPQKAVARINTALNSALDDPGIRRRLRDQSVPDERFATTPQEFGAWIAAEYARWGEVIKDAESNEGPAELRVRSHRTWEGESSWRQP